MIEYTITITITDRLDKRTGVAVLKHGDDVFNIVERDYIEDAGFEIEDAHIIADLSKLVPQFVMIWGTDVNPRIEYGYDDDEPLTGEQEITQHDAPFGEFPNSEQRGMTAEQHLEEQMLSGDYSDLGQTMVSIARSVDAQQAFENGDDFADLTDEEK